MSKISAFYATLLGAAALNVTFHDEALAKALAEREAKKAAEQGESLLRLFDATAAVRENLLRERVLARESLTKAQARIKAFMQCVDYANVEGNFIPLVMSLINPLDYDRLQALPPKERRADQFRYSLQRGSEKYLTHDAAKALLALSDDELLKISFVPEGWTPPQGTAIADPALTS
jgi:hypothetical protein